MLKLLKYGNTITCFVVGEGQQGLLVDTDWAGTLPLFFREIKRAGIALADIAYVMATHYHPDHMGLISELAELGIKHLVLDVQRDCLHFSDDIFGRKKGTSYKPIDDSKAVVISCAESRAFLHDIGISGEIIHTPAHSRDSVTLILDGGTALAGDLPPCSNIEAYDDNEMLASCWESILSRKPQAVFYSHAPCEKF